MLIRTMQKTPTVLARRTLTQARALSTSATVRNGILCSSATPSAIYPWINGIALKPTNSVVDWLTIENPATQEPLTRLAHPTPFHLETALTGAHSAFLASRQGELGGWGLPHVRASALRKLADLLRQHTSKLVTIEVAQTGRCIRELRAQLGRLGEWFDYYASLLSVQGDSLRPVKGKQINIVERLPLGVVLQVTPYNHPLLIALKKIAPALAAGNAVMVKPSEVAPLTVLALAELAQEAGIPGGMLNVIPGRGQEICSQLLQDRGQRIRKVDLTGGTKAGDFLGALAGQNLIPFTAELGGKAPVVVAQDAALQPAVNGTAFAAYVASGQTCVTASRAIVHQDLFESFVEALVAKTAQITERIGDPSNPATALGSLISQSHREKVQQMVDRAVGSGVWRVAIGGASLNGLATQWAHETNFDLTNGAFYQPTVLVPQEGVSIQEYTASEIWNEEVFGPVLLSVPAVNDTEAIQLANASKYALGASVWTESLSRAHTLMDGLRAGVVWCNTHHRNDPSSPWGGFVAQPSAESMSSGSGMGSENGPEALHEYTVCRSRTISLASPEERLATDDWFAETGARYG